MDPEEFLAFVHHAEETAEARVFGFEQGESSHNLGIIFHVHFSEVFHQQAVVDDIRHRRGARRSGH